MAEQRAWPYEPLDLSGQLAPPPAAPLPVPERVDEAEAEVPVSPSSPVSRTAILIAAVAAAVALLLAVSGVTDWWVRNRELDTLLDGVERSERAQHSFLDVAAVTRDTCLRRLRCDMAPVIQAAEVALVELQRSAEDVADTDIARFHGSIRTFRNVYLEHNRAWQEWVGEIVVRPVAFTEGDDAIDTTWEEVGDAAPRAVPPLPLNDARGRIDRILHA